MTDTKQADLFETPFEMAEREYQEAAEKHDEATNKMLAARKLRDSLCPHTEVEEQNYYFEGSYYDTAYTDYWNMCKCCGAKSEVTREKHSWYG